jgi:hypothetical protein
MYLDIINSAFVVKVSLILCNQKIPLGIAVAMKGL